MSTIELIPRVSEKAYDLSKDQNVYVFDIPRNVSKQQVAKAVESQFDVSVNNVNLHNVKGKAKRMINRRGRATHGKRSDIKRAYVTVKSGDYIPVFAAIDEAQEKAEKAQRKAQAKGKK